MNQRVRQTQPLLHAAGQHIHIAVALIAQANKLEQLVDHAHALLIGKAVAAGVKVQVFPGFQPVVHAEEIGHVADQLAHAAGGFAHVHPIHHRRARGGRQKRGQDAHGGAFARAVGADKAVQLAVADLYAQPVQRRKPAVYARQFLDFQHVSSSSPQRPARAYPARRPGRPAGIRAGTRCPAHPYSAPGFPLSASWAALGC